MSEFNKAVVEQGAASKRKRLDGGIIFENAKEIGESMYHTLVTRDATPLTATGQQGYPKEVEIVEINSLQQNESKN